MEDKANGAVEMASYDEAIRSALGALSPERLQEVVEEEATKAVRIWVHNALAGYHNPIGLAFAAQIEKVMVPAIERAHIDNARLDLLISQVMQQSAIGERAELIGKLGELTLGERRDVVAASEVFERYQTYVAQNYDCTGREVEDGEYLTLMCGCELDVGESPRGYLSGMLTATLSLYVIDCDEDQEREMCREVSLYRWTGQPKDDSVWYVHFPPQPTLKSIARASSFDLYLARLDADNTKIRWDFGSRYETGEVEPDEHPELVWE